MARRLSRRTRWPVVAPAAIAAAIVVVLVLAGCGPTRRGPTYPPAGATPVIATTQTAVARAAVAAALGATGLQVIDATTAYRPPEGAWLASAPRTVLELDVPGQGAAGFVVLYGFGSSTDAATAARDQASYVSGGSGRIYFAADTRFTIRVVGSAVVFFAWSPGSGDPRLADVEAALGSVGTGIPVPA